MPEIFTSRSLRPGTHVTSENGATLEVVRVNSYENLEPDCVISIDEMMVEASDLRELAEQFNLMADALDEDAVVEG